MIGTCSFGKIRPLSIRGMSGEPVKPYVAEKCGKGGQWKVSKHLADWWDEDGRGALNLLHR